jgi:DNA-binding winged helix-turn-helix (wHTH) protein/tetratricopeptide (TPR) repeat protein
MRNQSATNQTTCYRFGPFEVQTRSGVLLKDGQRMPIQQLPFSMLITLLESPGEIISQDNLRARLWDKTQFADFDSGVRVAARKLRESLGDDAAEPRYVRTITGRGYQFIAEVNCIPETPATPVPSTPQSQYAKALSPQNMTAGSSTTKKYWRWIVACLIVAVVALASAAYLGVRSRRPLLGRDDKVVLDGITGADGSRDLHRTLLPPLQVKLEESPYLNIAPASSYQQALREKQSPSQADKLHACAAIGAQALLVAIIGSGSNPSFTLQAWDCRSGKLLDSEKAAAASPSALLDAIGSTAMNMRRRLGEPASSLERFNAPVERATTGSVAALKAFTIGEDEHGRGREAESIPDYALAIALDPQFAMAYAKLGTVYENIGDGAKSRESYQKAFELRDRTTDRERLYIASKYYSSVTGEIDNSIRTYEIWQQLYPRDVVPVNNLAALYIDIGQPEKALPLARRAVALAPERDLLYGTLVRALLLNGKLSEVSSMCEDPKHAASTVFWFHFVCYLADFADGHTAQMQREIEWSKSSPLATLMLDAEAKVAFNQGDLQLARQLFNDASADAIDHGMKDLAIRAQVDQATLLAETGDVSAANQFAEKIQPDAQSAFDLAFTAVVYARTGNIPRALALAKQSQRMAPTNTLLNAAVLPTVYATVALAQNNPKEAIPLLEPVRRYDWNASMELAPVYYRGLAYLANGQAAEASREFQDLLKHRDIAPNSLYLALAVVALKRSHRLEFPPNAPVSGTP